VTQAKILVVEDEAIVALDTTNRLRDLGYEPSKVVTSGEEAVQTAEEMHPDLVLMDIQLKGKMDGVQAAEQIRSKFDIPVVFMTAHSDDSTIQRAKITQPFGYLFKPFDKRELQIALEVALYKHKMDRRLKESERRLAATLTGIGDGVITTDIRGRIQFMNPVAQRLTGWLQQEALGKKLVEVFNIVDAQTRVPAENVVTRALRQGNVVTREHHALLISQKGHEIPIHDNAAPILDAQGKISGAVLIFRDIRQQLQAEERLRAIYQLGRDLTPIHDEIAIFNQVTQVATKMLLVKQACYGQVHRSAGELECTHYQTNGTPEATKLRLPLEDEDDIRVAAVRSGQTIGIPAGTQDVGDAPPLQFQTRYSELCVPVKIGTRVVGVLAVQSFETDPFSAEDRQLLQTLADQAAIAVENTRLYDEIRQRIAELATLNEISHAIGSSLDLQETLTIVTDHATRLLDAEAASVVLRDPVRGKLRFAAASGKGANVIYDAWLREGQGIVGWVIRHGTPTLVPNVSEDPRFFDQFDQRSGFETRSILCVPLQTQSNTIGAIEVMNRESGPFDQEDMRLLTSLASAAATAIENARLHAETEQRAEHLTVLHELDQAITTSLHITDVYYALARHAGRLLAYDRLCINLIQGDQVRVTYVADEAEDSPRAGILLPLRTSSVGWVAAKGQPLLRHNVTADNHFPGDEPLIVGGIHSVMIIPLRAKGKVIGTCNFGSRQRGVYSPDDLVITQFIADQLAIAIENAQLFEAERRARQTAETLRAANQAFTQTLDLDAVLEALLDYLRRFVPYDKAHVMLVEKDSGVIVRAIRGLEGQTDFSKIQLEAEDTELPSVIRTLMDTQKSLMIPDISEYEGWSRPPDTERIGSWLGVPLVASGEVIGLCSMNKAQPGYFTQEHQDLAESLAAQAAIAIQNARLFEQIRIGRERLQTLSRRLVEVQETERRHIARELHDQAGQSLASLMVGLRLLEERANQGEVVAGHVAELKTMADGVLESLHQLASDLRPASLDHLGLVEALRQHVQAFGRQHNLMVQFEAVGLDSRRLAPDQETALFRIVQEALTNVVRHAQATRADVLLERHGNRVIAIVEDDGLGFDPQLATHSGRLGLLGMRERAEMLNGTLAVESSPGAGTTLFVEVPYVNSNPDR
jgi:PAS domain S-box-containing protein